MPAEPKPFAGLEPGEAANATRRRFGGPRFPVSPYDMALRMGVRWYLEDLGPRCDGAVIRLPNGDTGIFLSWSTTFARRHFTAAHVLGHYVKRAHEGQSFAFLDERRHQTTECPDPEEIWANRFATELLMPAAEVRARIERGCGLLDLAEHFRLSVTMILRRLEELQLTAMSCVSADRDDRGRH